MVEAALHASGKQLVVVAVHLGEGGPRAEGEVKEDLVRDLLEILTSACGRLYGRRSARNRAKRALEVMGCG
jgi:putative resolvase